jgi:hypothetical protein
MYTFDGELQRTRFATLHLRPIPTESIRDHRALVEAIRARDGEKARQIHLAHRDRGLNEMLRVVGDYTGFVLRGLMKPTSVAKLRLDEKTPEA